VGLLMLIVPVAIQELVNTAAFGTVLQPLLVLVIALAAALVIAGLLRVQKAWVVEVLQRHMLVDSVAQLAHTLPRLDPTSRARRSMGHPVHRFFDLFVAQKTSASLLLSGVDVVLAAGVGLLVLAAYHPTLLAYSLALVAMLAVVLLLGRRGVVTAVDQSTAKHELAELMADIVASPHAFRDQGGREYARARLDALAASYLHARARHFRVVLRQFSFTVLTQAVASAALLGLGGVLVIERELTIGQLVAAELIVMMLVSAFSDLGKHIETYYDLVASLYKLDSLLELPLEAEPRGSAQALGQGPAQIELRELSVKAGNRELLARAGLTLAAGSRTVLVGAAESGKSSLLDLLFGLRRAEHGSVCIDDIDVRELSKDALRSRVALVRGPDLVRGTVFENVALGNPGVSAQSVRRIVDALGLDDELSRLPEGLDTVLGPGGDPLTPSQALRLTIARAMARSPGLIALDADLGTVDARSLRTVLAALADPNAPWTLVLVGDGARDHAPAGMRIMRLHDGGFREEGAT
jgi:putative ABC transport system ATP-binding protein